MAALTKISTPYSPNELAKLLNDSFSELETRKADTEMFDDYYSKDEVDENLEVLDSAITKIVDGTTIPAKARTLEPETQPGPLKYFGTSAGSQLGFHDVPQPEDPASIKAEPFTETDPRWTGPSEGYYLLAIPHLTKYPVGVYKQTNVDEFTSVSVDIIRDNANIRIRSYGKFSGYILIG